MAILEYGSFEPKEVLDGTQVILFFGDYELSIVSHSGSYGGHKGLYEIGVFKGNNMITLPGITEDHDTRPGWGLLCPHLRRWPHLHHTQCTPQ